jgi:hypothetical protein
VSEWMLISVTRWGLVFHNLRTINLNKKKMIAFIWESVIHKHKLSLTTQTIVRPRRAMAPIFGYQRYVAENLV